MITLELTKTIIDLGILKNILLGYVQGYHYFGLLMGTN
jgi:hypothetical protein